MSKLLIFENPLMIIPSLAEKIGLNESIILQQFHYWLERSNHIIDGKKWIFNTYKDWHQQFPFWSESTIKRIIKALEEKGYLVSGNWNRSKMDKTKWYTIDYEKLEESEEPSFSQEEPSLDQNDTTRGEIWNEEQPELNQAIPEITTEITTEKKPIPFSEIVNYLNEKTNSTYKAGTKKTQDLIRLRWREGFTLEDFKTVIDLKAEEWLNKPEWEKYLRPETLFGPKFESYLNQKAKKQTWRGEDFDLND